MQSVQHIRKTALKIGIGTARYRPNCLDGYLSSFSKNEYCSAVR